VSANSIMYADLSLLTMALCQNSALVRDTSQISYQHWGEELVMCAHLGKQEYKILNRLSYQVCIIKLTVKTDGSNLSDHQQVNFANRQIVQSLFERYAFRAFIDTDKDNIIVLMFDQIQLDCNNAQAVKKEMMQHIPKKLESILNCQGDCKYDVGMGVSTPYRGFRTVQTAYEEAKKILSCKTVKASTIFYDELTL
jgi:sugar diacid utilization regulator